MQEEIKQITKEDLSHFIGTEQYTKGFLNVLYTDGIVFLMNNGLSWLVTDISSYKVHEKVKNLEFQAWTLTVKKNKGVLTLTDGNENIILKQNYSYTNCPIETIKMYLVDNVLMLASEY